MDSRFNRSLLSFITWEVAISPPPGFDVTPDEMGEVRRYLMEIVWSDEDDEFLARFPEAPGVVTHGSTVAEAAMQGEDAIITWLTARRDAGLPLPAPKPRSTEQRG